MEIVGFSIQRAVGYVRADAPNKVRVELVDSDFKRDVIGWDVWATYLISGYGISFDESCVFCSVKDSHFENLRESLVLVSVTLNTISAFVDAIG